MRRSVDFLYSLYDALVSINVPSDKARAVVDAMERDMATTLATKQDLQPFATREDIRLVREDLLLVKQDLKLVRQEVENRYVLLARELESLRTDLTRDIEALRTSTSKDMEALRLSMTVRLGGMLFVSMGLLFAALKLT